MECPSSVTYIRTVQRKNGKIIIRAMLELDIVTIDTITDKICEDYNIFHGKWNVAIAVRDFLRFGYYLGFIDVNEDKSFDINHSIKRKMEKQLKAPEAENADQSSPISNTPRRKRLRNQ